MTAQPPSSEPQPPALGSLLRLAFPLIVIQLAATAMQFTDAWMVGKLGSDALAAVLPAGLIYFVPVCVMMGAVGAVSTFVSQALGRGRDGECGLHAWHGIGLGLFSGLAMLPFWWIARPVFAGFAHTAEVQALEVVYFRLSLLGAPAFLVSSALSGFFTGIHRPGILAVWALVATLLNIPLNAVLIFGGPGIAPMGIAGAALGTVIATWVQAGGLLVAFLRSDLRFGTRRLRFHAREALSLIRVGIPSGLQSGFDIVSWGVVLVWMVGWFGTAHLAATTVNVRWIHVSFMPAIGIGTVLTALVGRSIGAGRPDLAEGWVRLARRVCVGYMGTVGLLFLLFRRELVGLMSSDPEVIAAGAAVMVWVALFQVFDALNVVYNFALRGAGDTLWPALATAVLCGAIFIGGGWYLGRQHPEFGSAGPWAAGAAYLAALGTVVAWRWHRGPWRKIALVGKSTSRLQK